MLLAFEPHMNSGVSASFVFHSCITLYRKPSIELEESQTLPKKAVLVQTAEKKEHFSVELMWPTNYLTVMVS